MLINAIEPEESRIAIVEENVLEEFYIERHSQQQSVGNIYKGKVVNIETSIQASFVDLGLKKNGFLYVADIMIEDKPIEKPVEKPDENADEKPDENADEKPDENADENGNTRKPAPKKKRRTGKDKKVQINSILRKGQSIVVQITKSGIGEKGPALTSFISLPGKYLVLMPNAKRNGVSRRITDEEERKRLKKLIEGLDVPPNMGVIIRTAGLDQTKRELNRDLKYLQRLWEVTSKQAKISKAPAALYQESDLVIRAIRDFFNTDVTEVIIDSPEVYKRARDFMKQVMPKYATKVKLYTEPEPLFHKFKLEDQLEKINYREVLLQSGGSIIIDLTEALVTIDVNSKKFKEETDPEETSTKTNLEAAEEIARQLRLRDIGGEVVIDFIDMRDPKHIRKVEKKLEDALKRDKARITILKMSKFCIVEMTRQRMRPSIRDVLYANCPHCTGTGFIKTEESIGLEIMRTLKFAVNNKDIKKIEIAAKEEVIHFIQNQKRREIARLEETYDKIVTIVKYNGTDKDRIKIKYFSSNGQPVKL